jgi:quercetin dioxygenase-like cupin family protein
MKPAESVPVTETNGDVSPPVPPTGALEIWIQPDWEDDDRRIILQDPKCFFLQEGREMKARAVVAVCIFVSGVSILQTCTNGAALHAQDSSATTHEHLVVPGCVKIAPGQRRPEFGFFCLATESGLRFSEPTVYWHIRTFPNRAAADAAKSATGIVVEEDGRVWLSEFGPRDFPLEGGQAVAVVGPMELSKAELYAVDLGYAVLRPDDRSIVHVHPGPEGWYMISGEQCLETPAGATRAKAGGTATAPPNVPMELTITGTAVRKSLVLVIHDPSQPAGRPSDWKPKGLCAP